MLMSCIATREAQTREFGGTEHDITIVYMWSVYTQSELHY
jgi:hypothetical protein